jgi:nickel-dependent lactate racemase
MRVNLAYGSDGLDVELPDRNVTVIEPVELPGLSDEAGALRDALRNPIAAPPLAEVLAPAGEVAVVFPDITRPMPSSRVLPVLLGELERAGVGRERIVLLNATGTHRVNTPEELEQMIGADVLGRYEVVNHDCRDNASLVHAADLADGTPIGLNRRYVAASTRILTGFIEPHFFAGFSGGPKGACPGLAGLETVLECHNVTRIGSPLAAYGVLDGNPVHEMVREAARLVPPSFSLDVTINSRRAITGIFAGGLPDSHRVGCEFVRRTAMRPVAQRFDIVITTNSGYPLDQNLYQTVKGMAAAALIVKPGGAIIVASECREGLPNGGEYARLLEHATSIDAAIESLRPPGHTLPDQWELQVQALIQKRARCFIYTDGLTPEQVRGALLERCVSIEQTLAALLREQPDAQIAVLPQGPQTIPYVVD